MNRGYWLGMGLSLGLIAGGVWLLSSWFVPAPGSFVAFATPLLDRTDAPIPYGQTREYQLQLQNRGSSAVRVDEVSFDKPFAVLRDGLSLPQRLGPHSSLSIPVRISAEQSQWSEYQITARALVSNRRASEMVSMVIQCDIAAHLNPDPPLVQFGRVERTVVIAPRIIRLWSPASIDPLKTCEVESNDPAVRVTVQPVQLVDRGRRYQWELRVEIDAAQAQPEHRSQIVVHTGPNDPQVVIPIAGWVNDESPPEKSSLAE